MRHKLKEEEKKKDISITINNELNDILEKYMVDNNIKNKSRYIENLVKKDMESRGENVEKTF